MQKENNTDGFVVNYNHQALIDFVTKLRLAKTTIAKQFNHSNNLTINRWLEGKDIYLCSLLAICNRCKLDLLSFFNVNGRTLESSVLDIAKLEEAGISIASVLREHGIEPTNSDESVTLTMLNDEDVVRKRMGITTITNEQNQHNRNHNATGIATLPSDVIDRIIAVQTSAHEHEREALDRQGKAMQMLIDEKDKQIAELQKELKRLRTIERSNKPYVGIVADDNLPSV